MRNLLSFFIFLAAFALIFSPSAEASEEKFERLGKRFRVFRAEPKNVRLVWQGENGKPLFSFKNAYAALKEEQGEVKLLMNGGIFEPRQIPSGLYIEKGVRKRPLNLANKKGNFFLKPNAVFYLKKAEGALQAGVVESGALESWGKEEKAKLWYAVQSGPALLLDGKTHPAFNRGSKSELLRNGVGVDQNGAVVFVITDGQQNDCNLWTFADCFRALGCENALFLDGDISQMKVNPKEKVKGHGFSTMFGVVEGE